MAAGAAGLVWLSGNLGGLLVASVIGLLTGPAAELANARRHESSTTRRMHGVHASRPRSAGRSH